MKKILSILLAALFILIYDPIVLGDIYIENGVPTENPRRYVYDDFQLVKNASSGINIIYDYPKGYSLFYPANLEIDTSLSEIKTVLANKDTQIEIYRDNFAKTTYNFNSYHSISNYFLNNGTDHKLQENRTVKINDHTAYLLKWNRAKLKQIENDKNNYLSLEIAVSPTLVYTIIVKSSHEVDAILPYLTTFNLIETQGAPHNNTIFKPVEKDWNEETKLFFDEYFSPEAKINWGIYEHTAPASLDFLKQLESKLGHRFSILTHYHTFHTPFPMQELKNAYAEKRIVELTLQTMWFKRDNNSTIYQILNGDYDVYFKNYALKAKEFGHPILFRFNNEMNAEWCSYSSYFTSKDPELFKAMWRHIYSIFQENGADNVLWIWNPTDVSYPTFKWNSALNYFPGNEYVDIVGLTGYNTGTYYQGENWRTFSQIYDPLYTEYCLAFDYPFMITEFASSSVGGNKELWIADMFKQIERFKKIKVAIWFNGVDFDANMQQARKYRLDDTQAVVNAFKDGFKQYN